MTTTRDLTELDDAGLLAAADPGCTGAFLLFPEIDLSGDIPTARLAFEAAADALPPPVLPPDVEVRDLDVPEGVPPLRLYDPATRLLPGAAILWIHGGGLVAGRVRENDLGCAQMAAAHGCPVVSVDYRLAPENPYPAGLDDCFAALTWVLGGGIEVEPGRLLVAGASAGGCLALALGLLARDRGVTGVSGLVLEYPMLDDRGGSPSMERATSRRTWHREANRHAWAAYLDGLQDPPYTAAPGRATVDDLRGLPPVFVDVGTLDGFFDEDVDLAVRLAHAGVPVELVVTPGAFHASERVAPDAVTSRRILQARYDARQRMLEAFAAR